MTSQTPASGLIRDENMNAYMPGFGNDFETEALPDALPQGKIGRAACRERV